MEISKPVIKLSDNFTLSEFLRSRTAVQRDFREQFCPPCNVIDNLLKLVALVLQPARVEFQSWIYVTSGYRCKRLNEAVGGSPNSDHMRGQAADVTCKDVKGLYDLILALDLPFYQLIHYRGRNFLHISHREDDIKKQTWVI